MTQVDRIDDLKVGEIPNPLVYTFLDSNGNPLNISGYTAKANFAERSGGVSVSGATVAVTDPVNGKVTYTFTGNEFPTAGHWQIELWVGNAGTRRFASVQIDVDVHWAIGPVPAI
jgi:BppU N-terminal domain